MPSFKPKTTKKIKVNKKNSTTLDGKHREFINEFNKNEQDHIPKMTLEREELKEKLNKNLTEPFLNIEQVMETKDRLKEINENIKKMKSKKIDYFLDNSKYIFDYFENKKNISKGNVSSNKNKALETFFKINKISIFII